MRSIEKEMIQAVKACKNFKKSNTVVKNLFGSMYVYLHDNLIAVVREKDIMISSCGWNTVTTKSRINALLDGLGYSGYLTLRGGSLMFNHGVKVAPFTSCVIAKNN